MIKYVFGAYHLGLRQIMSTVDSEGIYLATRDSACRVEHFYAKFRLPPKLSMGWPRKAGDLN